MCVCEHVCRYGCVCASMFSGEGNWGGGFCNVFCRKRTQMTFNPQCFGGNSRVLFAHCNFVLLEVGVPACIRETELGGRLCKYILAEEREGFGDQQWDSASVHCWHLISSRLS